MQTASWKNQVSVGGKGLTHPQNPNISAACESTPGEDWQ